MEYGRTRQLFLFLVSDTREVTIDLNELEKQDLILIMSSRVTRVPVWSMGE